MNLNDEIRNAMFRVLKQIGKPLDPNKMGQSKAEDRDMKLSQAVLNLANSARDSEEVNL